MKAFNVLDILVAQEEAERQAQAELAVLDFSRDVRELKKKIASAMRPISLSGAQRVLAGVRILPRPSMFTIAYMVDGYAILFVVGPDYKTHPVEVRSSQ